MILILDSEYETYINAKKPLLDENGNTVEDHNGDQLFSNEPANIFQFGSYHDEEGYHFFESKEESDAFMESIQSNQDESEEPEKYVPTMEDILIALKSASPEEIAQLKNILLKS